MGDGLRSPPVGVWREAARYEVVGTFSRYVSVQNLRYNCRGNTCLGLPGDRLPEDDHSRSG
jgi:hypothetical protein